MKHYIIYQIRNKLNGMIYIGQHQTENLDDGYMGSGKGFNMLLINMELKTLKRQFFLNVTLKKK